MKKHTNLDNEIQGNYYEAKLSWWRLSLAIFVLAGVVLALIDWLVGPEVVTSVGVYLMEQL